jgi:iron complex transport system ATP-binding protein
MAYVAQQPFAGFPLTVEELVSLGRYPHRKRFPVRAGFDGAVEKALRLTETLSLRERNFTMLSGGEKQKVLIARALAQTSELLLLDEPTVHLDLYCQLEILGGLKRLCSAGSSTVIAVLHDLNLVSLFADKALLLKSGSMVAFGPTAEVLTERRIADVFGVEVAATRDPSGLIYYFPRR